MVTIPRRIRRRIRISGGPKNLIIHMKVKLHAPTYGPKQCGV